MLTVLYPIHSNMATEIVCLTATLIAALGVIVYHLDGIYLSYREHDSSSITDNAVTSFYKSISRWLSKHDWEKRRADAEMFFGSSAIIFIGIVIGMIIGKSK